MAIVPSTTRFVGFAPGANLQERKSANINALSQPYTMADIASAPPQIEIIVTGGVISTNGNGNCYPVYQAALPFGSNNSIEIVNSWFIDLYPECVSITIPNESYFSYITITDNSNTLEEFSAPNLINCLNSIGISIESLTTVNIGTIGNTRQIGGISLGSCALSEETVNYILALLVSLDGTNNTVLFNDDVYLADGTSAAPTGQGLIDKQTLIDRGCNVTTN